MRRTFRMPETRYHEGIFDMTCQDLESFRLFHCDHMLKELAHLRMAAAVRHGFEERHVE